MQHVIETERLILRAFTEDDLAAFYLLGTHPDLIRYAGNQPYLSLEHAREMLHAAPLRDYAEYGFGRFACVWKASGELIGFSGLKFLPELDAVELGYRFLPQWWGLGLATEAGRVSVDFGRDVLQLEHLVSVIHPGNHASANVVRKLGFVLEQQRPFELLGDTPADIWGRTLR